MALHLQLDQNQVKSQTLISLNNLCQKKKKWITVLLEVHLIAIHRNILTFFPLKLSELYFHPLEAMSRYRDTQLEVGKNYSFVSN